MKLISKRPAGILAWVFLLQTARAVTFQIADPVEFHKIIDTNAVHVTNATINTWLEGPTWIPASGFLVFCGQNNNRLKKLVPPATVTDFLLLATRQQRARSRRAGNRG